jgi:hypothetical protein
MSIRINSESTQPMVGTSLHRALPDRDESNRHRPIPAVPNPRSVRYAPLNGVFETRVQTSTSPASLVDLSRLAQALATAPSTSASPKSAAGTKVSAQEIALRLDQSRPAPSPSAKPSQSTTWGTSVWNRAVDNDVVITPAKPRFPDSVWDRAVDNDVVIPPAKPRFPDSVWDRAVD